MRPPKLLSVEERKVGGLLSMAANLIPISPPHSLFFRPRHYTTTPTSSSWSHLPSPLINPLTRPYGELRLTPLFSTPSASSLVEEEEENSASPSTQAGATIEDADKLPFRGCKACGREEVERGCNGEGRIQGGIATVPGFGWWPIKAYRPCPGFVESGGRYRRRGQSMDEVAWGRSEKPAPMAGIDKPQPSKKKKISQKSKG